MSNIDAVNALLTAIHFDRYAEIEARHAPDAVFMSFRGPTLRDSVAIADWHREFLRDYADCNYTELEYIESGNTVALRATIEAKGYDWRAFTQRVVEVFDFDETGAIVSRRLYAMLPDLELDKAATAALANAVETRGGSASGTKAAAEAFAKAQAEGDAEGMKALLAEKAALIDSVYGVANGPGSIVELTAKVPRPAFGYLRATSIVAGQKDALAEISVDPARPRAAQWMRVVDGKIAVVETYWMLREIGVAPETKTRHMKQVILPI